MPDIPLADASTINDEYETLHRSDLISRDPDRYHDVRITAPGITGFGARIELDGMPLKAVRSYAVRVGVTEVSEVTVTFIAGSVNREDADGIASPLPPGTVLQVAHVADPAGPA